MCVVTFGCSYETADIEFEMLLAQAMQKGNNLAHHLIQSFAPGKILCLGDSGVNGDFQLRFPAPAPPPGVPLGIGLAPVLTRYPPGKGF